MADNAAVLELRGLVWEVVWVVSVVLLLVLVVAFVASLTLTSQVLALSSVVALRGFV